MRIYIYNFYLKHDNFVLRFVIEVRLTKTFVTEIILRENKIVVTKKLCRNYYYYYAYQHNHLLLLNIETFVFRFSWNFFIGNRTLARC